MCLRQRETYSLCVLVANDFVKEYRAANKRGLVLKLDLGIFTTLFIGNSKILHG